MLYLTEEHVRKLLPVAKAIELVREAFERLARGEAVNQPRRRLILPTGSTLHYMAASDGKYFGAKIYATNPKSGAHFLFLLYRAEDAVPLAVLEANQLGQIRTGAASGLATSLMANPSADSLGMIGTGFQARTQIEAVAAVRQLRRVLVWSPSAERRARFARECTETLGIPVEAAESAESAIRQAPIVITATNARDPVLESAWVAPGAHINAMGSNQARRRELPADLVMRADCVAVDSLEQSRMEAGDLILAFQDSDWNSKRVVELSRIVAGEAPPRLRPESITIFKSNGLAIEDVISAGWVYERAVESGLDHPVHS